MLNGWTGLVTTGLLVVALSGCVQDPALVGATSGAPAVKALPVGDAATIYAAKQDGAFVVPPVPVEKVPEALRRQEVVFETEDAPGTIIINPANKTLHLVTGKNRAIRYGIAVGKDGFQWSGEALITDRKPWPTWTPPKEMIERKPELAKWEDGQPGGPTNPLGARALYLTTNGVDYGYRIHGTPEWQSIGSNASSGCIRMINQDVMDLYDRVPNGVKVVVLNRDGTRPTGLSLPPPQPRKVKKVEPAAAAVPAKPSNAPAPGFPAMTAPAVTPTLGAPGLGVGAVPPALVAPTPAVAPATPTAAPAPSATPAPAATTVEPAPAPPAPAPAATDGTAACVPLPGQTTCP